VLDPFASMSEPVASRSKCGPSAGARGWEDRALTLGHLQTTPKGCSEQRRFMVVTDSILLARNVRAGTAVEQQLHNLLTVELDSRVKSRPSCRIPQFSYPRVRLQKFDDTLDIIAPNRGMNVQFDSGALQSTNDCLKPLVVRVMLRPYLSGCQRHRGPTLLGSRRGIRSILEQQIHHRCVAATACLV
jgi:hypothetical protein